MSTMKTLATAMVAVAGSVAGNAHAISIITNPTPGAILYMAGATAQENNVERAVISLCKANTTDFYYDGTLGSPTPSGSNDRAYYCLSQGVSGLVDGTKIMIRKTSTTTRSQQGTAPIVTYNPPIGGSALGVYPVRFSTKLDVMPLNASACGTSPTGTKTVSMPTGNITVPLWSCSITAPQLSYPEMGVADVDPLLFKGENLPSVGFKALTPLQVKGLKIQASGHLGFNTPVTVKLRNALQEAQIAEGKLPAGCVGQETEECMPSLSSSLVASLLQGNVGDWNKVKVKNGGSLVGLFDFASSGNRPTSSLVKLCTRESGSGTKAAIQATFMRYPCTAGALPMTTLNDPIQGPLVTENASSGAVDNCLDGSDDGNWALGILATDRNVPSSGVFPKKYRYIKINGVSPTLENLASGSYPYAADGVYLWKTSLGGSKLLLAQAIAAKATEAAILKASNKTYPWGTSGYLAYSSTASADLLNNPVTSLGYGSPTNDCAVPAVSMFDDEVRM